MTRSHAPQRQGRFCSCASAALCFLLLAAPARAQLVRGAITDRLSNRPIMGAVVEVLNPDSSLRAVTATGDDGTFTFTPTVGLFILRVKRPGFATTRSRPLELSQSDTLNVEVRLPRSPVALEPLNVVAKPADPSGFYERRNWGWGKFIGPEEIERIHPTQVGDVVVGSPGFFSYPARRGWITRMENRGRSCSPTVYLDHALVARGSATSSSGSGAGVRLDELAPASQIRAVELYQHAREAPAEFHANGGPGGGDCGVIVLWTYVGFGR